MRPGSSRRALAIIGLTSASVACAQGNPLAKYLEVPGAKTTLPVSSGKSPFSLEFAQEAQKRFENFHHQLATSTNAALVEMCGPRGRYPGERGVVKEGARADLILVDGDPLEKTDPVADAANNCVVIMQDGVIYQNTL